MHYVLAFLIRIALMLAGAAWVVIQTPLVYRLAPDTTGPDQWGLVLFLIGPFFVCMALGSLIWHQTCKSN